MLYNITHAADLDGMASAAFLARCHGMPTSNIIFINYGAQDVGRATEKLSGIRGGGNVLVITDFSMTRENSSMIDRALARFRRRGNSIIWLDHHPWPDSMIRKASKYCDLMVVGENTYFCGAELVYHLLCDRDRYGDELARITHLSDFWLKSKSRKDNEAVNAAALGIKQIRSYADWEERLRGYVHELSQHIDSRIILDAYEEYMRMTRPAMESMLKECGIIKSKRVKIGVGFGTMLSAQEACMAIIERLKCDISIYISAESMHGSIRSRRNKGTWGIDILKLAESLNGGGHPLAAGFSVENEGYDLSKAHDRKLVLDRIGKTAERLYGKRIRWFQQSTGRSVTR
ncbi:MAG: DHHA1 domain-containing protein [Candidatus Marsarchaeota archaeon]|nr:DHHA1 domain-containing protein [Candidatus Marsarchaeota archaeon]MCL5111873.1 DHHA1 domain-containing protein [Candidatus Marsarchaeota archaeon]